MLSTLTDTHWHHCRATAARAAQHGITGVTSAAAIRAHLMLPWLAARSTLITRLALMHSSATAAGSRRASTRLHDLPAGGLPLILAHLPALQSLIVEGCDGLFTSFSELSGLGTTLTELQVGQRLALHSVLPVGAAWRTLQSRAQSTAQLGPADKLQALLPRASQPWLAQPMLHGARL